MQLQNFVILPVTIGRMDDCCVINFTNGDSGNRDIMDEKFKLLM
jgi:hypothetical protein